MQKEIERKYLVRALPENLEQSPHSEIAQGYLAADPDANEVRLRKYGDQHLLTAKAKLAPEIRIEREISLDLAQFEELWPATAGRRLFKTRYLVRWGSLVIEIDVYQGKNTGLIVAEVEFPDEQAFASFQGPEWLGEEISGQTEYSNYALAKE